ncbi:MAG: 1-deoxy-D-xylulose-5-phosphate reductoisomerase [Candidatus Nanopelagicales bacterium]
MTPRDVVILGSTGSIGTQALDVIARNPGLFRVVGLAAGGSDPDLLARQIIATGARWVAVARPGSAAIVRERVRELLREATRERARERAEGDAGDVVESPVDGIAEGPQAAAELAALDCDVVLNGMAGAVGLEPTLAALRAGNRVALANKESLIIGGPVVTRLAQPDQIVPVDSEHSALAQSLRGGSKAEVRRLILTASGGPFRGRNRADLADVTPEQALAHPTWSMGPLVTINSATLVNKGLELIEAHLLFDIGFDRLDVVIHPQSIVHSMVEFTDGSTIAQASPPDMRLPISLGLSWPDRVPDAAPSCDWSTAATWTFEPVDVDTFPAIRLAAQVGAAGGVHPAIFNAADEVAVAAFLAGRVSFPGIVDTVESVITEYDGRFDGNSLDVQDVLAADRWARTRATDLLSR